MLAYVAAGRLAGYYDPGLRAEILRDPARLAHEQQAGIAVPGVEAGIVVAGEAPRGRRGVAPGVSERTVASGGLALADRRSAA
jgi:hypothetical protein